MIPNNPRTKEDLLQALANLEGVELGFWLGIDSDRFARPFGQAWSPADTVRHLTKSTLPVARALRLPRLALWALFGRRAGTSRTFAELVGQYRAALAAGGKAGRFEPSPHRRPDDVCSWQQSLVAECQSAVGALARALERWNETDLDCYRLPHPLLGKLTVREMVLFTLHHHEHHKAGVARRLGTIIE